MQISDPLYGTFEITEPILLELINSNELQRLKKISMAGYYPGCASFGSSYYNRFNHSLGVFLLLRRFKAPLLEQIAGLIHDISHSAFSHTVDYIKKDLEAQKDQSNQDLVHDNFVRQSSIGQILQTHGFDLEYILDDRHFPLKENDLPNICADRLDYTLRQAFHDYHYLQATDVEKILDGLTIYNNSFVFKDQQAAALYSQSFFRLNEQWWTGMSSAVMYQISALYFRRAIEAGLVTFEEFYANDDEYILNKIKAFQSQDAQLAEYGRMLSLPPQAYENNPEISLDGIYVKNRIVNPFVLVEGALHRFSELDLEYAAEIKGLPKFKKYHVALKSDIAT